MASFLFDSLDIQSQLKCAIKDNLNFTRMTPVQSATINKLLQNNDVSVEAVTGSGKTLAFVIPLIHYSLKQLTQSEVKREKFHGQIHSIIISPTRELANQTFDVLNLLNNGLEDRLSLLLLIGGHSLDRDITSYSQSGGNIIIATPGRLADMLEKHIPFTKSVRENSNYLILDEADLMLNLGFEKTLNNILKKLPKQRRTGLFSATQTNLLEDFVRAGLRQLVKIQIKSQSENRNLPSGCADAKVKSSLRSNKNTHSHSHEENNASRDPKGEIDTTASLGPVSLASVSNVTISPSLSNYYHTVETYAQKLAFTMQFIKEKAKDNSTFKAIIFLSTCAQVDYFHRLFQHFLTDSTVMSGKRKKIRSTCGPCVKIYKLHRKLNKKRGKIFKNFSCDTTASVMLATDIIARGIDVKNLDCVLHIDLPNSLQDYVHRSGRSGHKIGDRGMSLLLVTPHEMAYVTLCKQKNISLHDYLHTHEKLEELPSSSHVIDWLKSEAATNFNIYQESVRALVSFVRTYASKNILSGTLVPQLDVVSLVRSFGLLKLPSMPEFRGLVRKEHALAYNSEYAHIVAAYDAEVINRKRKQTPVIPVANEELDCIASHNERRSKILRKITSTKLTGRLRGQMINDLEMDELAEDARMVKKVKKGKISEEAFDKHFGL